MKTAVGQVMVVGGHVYGEANGCLVDERRGAQGRDRGSLYILVEVPGQPPSGQPSSLGSQLAGVVHQAFYSRRGSVTAGLQQAVHEANRLLYEDNRNALPGERQRAGLSVAVLRGDDLFIAQAGPAAALIGHHGQMTRYPETSPWLEAGPGPAVLASLPPDEQDSPPLGDRSEINVALYHVQVEAGDLVLLLESASARCLPAAAWPAILAAGQTRGAQAALDALLAAAPGCDLAALALALGDPGPATFPASASLASPEEGLSTPFQDTIEEPARPWLSTLPAADAAGAPAVRRLPAAPARAASAVPRAEMRDRVATVLGPPAAALRTAAARLASIVLAALRWLWAAFLVLLRRLVPGHLGSGGQAGARARAAAPTARTARRGGPARASEPATRVRAPGDSMQKLLVVVAIAIPIIVGIVVGVTLGVRSTERQKALEADMQKAQESWQKANATTDPAAKRAALPTAQAVLDSILQREPDYPGAAELRARVAASLDDLGKVKRITAVTDLAAAYPADAELSRVVVQGLHVFVLDRKGGKVYHHQLEAGQKALSAGSLSAVLLSRGQQVGSMIVGDLVDMVWMGVDADKVRQRPALVIYESGGSLLEYDPSTNELNVLAVGARELRQFPRWVGSNYGRLYLVDTGARKVWRYAPTADGYNGAPDAWLTADVDLTGVKDAVVGDGLYLLYGDGRVQKLFRGAPVPFTLSGLDTALSSPLALATYPPDDTQSVYIADSGNARIVQTAPDGKFTRQYVMGEGQPDVLRGITSLFVEGDAGRAFFTSGGRLYMATLPK